MALPAALQNISTEVITEDQGMGNEGVGAESLAIPRINILHKLSPELDESHAKYLEDAKAGQFVNTVTSETFDRLYATNLKYSHEFTVFKKRALGGGFFGTFESHSAAIAALEAAEDTNPDEHDISETGTHTLLLLNEKGEIDSPVLMSFAASRLGVSKKWNTDIQLKANGGARFNTVWEISTTAMSNSKGSWHNPKMKCLGACPADMYEEAKKVFGELK